MRADWAPLLGLVAAITIMSATGRRHTGKLKRLLAYSSISNAGYLLLGLVRETVMATPPDDLCWSTR